MMAAHISANAVSTVAYLSQINMAISALGGGLAVGASIKISEAYGEGNFELVKRRVSTLFALCGLLGMAILAILIPVAPQFYDWRIRRKNLSRRGLSILFWN